MKKESKHILLLPEKLMTRFADIQHNPPQIIGFNIDRLQCIVSTILKHKQQKHPGAYSLLNMGYLRNIVPNAHDYINYLKRAGIIEYKNHFAGRNSRLYRICKQYEGPAVFRTVNDAKLNNRIAKNNGSLKRRNSKKYPVLNSYVYAVNIDHETALQTIEARYQAHRADDPEGAEARRTFSLAEVEKIRSGEIYISVSDINGRYDTNYTRLPSELVPHLTIDGQPLTEIDIRNSQPFFAVSLFNPSPEVERVMTDYLGSRLTIYIKSLHLAQYEDIKLYTSLVQSGGFYEFMMDNFRANGIEFADRAEAKELIFTVYFGKNNAVHYSAAVRLFRSLFPNVWRLFEIVKDKEHNRLAILLQRIESHVMLNLAARRIISELPEVKFITKHDSLLPSGLMVTNGVEQVERILTEVVTEVVGVKPLLKVKTASPLFSSIPIQSNKQNSPNPIPIPFMYMKTLQVTENEEKKEGRSLGEKLRRKEKKAQVIDKQAPGAVVDTCGPDSSPGRSLPGGFSKKSVNENYKTK